MTTAALSRSVADHPSTLGGNCSYPTQPSRRGGAALGLQPWDRRPQAKATGLRNLHCSSFASNNAWWEIVPTTTDLLAWCELISFIDEPELARCEVATFRYRVLHVAARSLRRPANPPTDRSDLAVGQHHRHRLAPHPPRLRLTPDAPSVTG